MPAIALCDRDGVYGAPRFFNHARELGVKAIVGAELTMEDQTILPVLVESRRGYQNLCQLLTRAHLRNEKGKPSVLWSELPEFAEGLVALTGDEEGPLGKIPNLNPESIRGNHQAPSRRAGQCASSKRLRRSRFHYGGRSPGFDGFSDGMRNTTRESFQPEGLAEISRGTQ